MSVLPLKPVLNTFLDAVKGFERASDPKLNAKIDPRLARFQQPVPKVVSLRQQHQDAFEGARDQKKDLKHTDLRFASSHTPEPRRGATDATAFLRDGFESATRKPVELQPRPPPSYKAPIPVFRFR